jgi:magnesium-transporting ATPase (P-type)
MDFFFHAEATIAVDFCRRYVNMQEKVTKPDGMPWHASSEQDVIAELQTSLSGLNDSEAAARLQRFGANTILRKTNDSPWLIFWRQINNPIGWLFIEALADMMPEFATALRGGQAIAVPAESLVPDDLVTLQERRQVCIGIASC